MAWPSSPLDPIVEFYLGPTLGWFDATASGDVRLTSADSGGGIAITRGRQDWGQDTDHATGALVLNNRHGNWSSRNPRADKYGLIGRNTPVRIGVRLLRDEFQRTEVNGWGSSPDTGAFLPPTAYGNLAGSASNFAVSAGLATQSHGVTNALRRVMHDIEVTDLEQYTEIRVPAAVTGAAVVTGHMYRLNADGHYYWCRLEFNAGAAVTVLYDWDTDAEGWAGEGSTSVQRVTTPVHDGAGSLRATMTMGAGFAELRFNDGQGLRDLSGNGPTLSAWVQVPAGSAGTGWQGRLELQDNGFTWMAGPNFDLTPGEWHLLTYTPPAALLANCRAIGFAIGATGVSGSQNIYVDTVAQFGTGTTTLKISKELGGGPVELAELVDVPGVSYTAGQFLRLRSCVSGSVLAVKAWNPAGPEPLNWTLVTTDTDLREPGQPGLQSWLVFGNTNALPFAVTFDNHELINRRLVAEVPAWPPRWDVSGRDVWVPLEFAGILRRLGKGKRPVLSPLARYWATNPSLLGVPDAYWPLEETDGVDQVSPGIPGGRVGTITGSPQWGGDDTLPGAARSVVLPDGARITMPVVMSQSVTVWSVAWYWKLGEAPALTAPLIQIRTTGTVARWEIRATPTDYDWQGFDAAGSLVDSVNFSFGIGAEPGEWITMQFNCFQSGGNVEWEGVWQRTVNPSAQYFTGSQSFAGTIGAVTQVMIGGDADAAGMAVGHVVASEGDYGFTVARIAAGEGYSGETAAARLERLAEQNALSLAIVGDPDDTTAMGRQRPGTLLELIRECVRADGGILFEDRALLGLVYRTRANLYNQPRHVSSYTAGHIAEPFEPVDDDQLTKNDVTATRADGGSYQVRQETGPLNVQEPGDDPDAVGPYEHDERVNVASASQLPDVAGWLKWLGTQDGDRYPQIHFDLTTHAYQTDREQAINVSALDSGDVAEIDDLPTWVPPGPALAMVQGYTETIDAYDWDITANATPGGAYTVATADGDERVPADGSTLVADITSSGTSLLLASTVENGPWVVGDSSSMPDDFPLPARIGGEVVTVAEIEPSVVDTFGGTSSSGWTPADTGQAWTHPVGSGTDYTEGSGKGQILMSAVNTLYSNVLDVGTPYAQYTVDLSLNVSSAPGASITLWVCAGWQGVNDYNFCRLTLSTGGVMSLGLLRRNGGSLTTVTPSIMGTANTSGDVWRVTWRSDAELLIATMQNITTGAQPVAIRGPATDGATGTGIAILARRESGSTGGTITASVDNLTVNSPQLVTVSSRGVNGIERGWPAGTPVDVAESAIGPL